MRFLIAILFLLAALPARAQIADCDFGFDIDRQSSAFQSMLVDGEQKKGFWLSVNRAPPEIRGLAKYIGRLQVCLITPDGKPREIRRGGGSMTLDSPFVANCTAALLPDNRLLTNAHCYFDPDLVAAGFSIVQEARINFDYTSKDDLGAVRTYRVLTGPMAVDEDLDALLLQVIGDANADLGGHIPMKMRSDLQPYQSLAMIHHPGAEPQQYSTGTCQIHRRQEEIDAGRSPLRHTCESIGGSSGSLLFDARTLAVVGLHNQGGLSRLDESFNGGHKIAMIDEAFGLGFEEVGTAAPAASPVARAHSRGEQARAALSEALLEPEAGTQIARLRAVIEEYPGTDMAKRAQSMLARLEDQQASALTTQANAALTEALLMPEGAAKLTALQAVARDYAGTTAAVNAGDAARRLEASMQAAQAAPAVQPRVQAAPRETTRQPSLRVCYVNDVRPPDAYLALRSQPSSRSGSRLRLLYKGESFSMVGPRQGDWHLVSTPDGLQGWVSWARSRWITCP